MKTTFFFLILVALVSCGKKPKKGDSIELITEVPKQDTIFKRLMIVTGSIPVSIHRDSLAFLVLPVQASCPACRKKAIDSIIKHQNSLLPNHFIIISANGGQKLISSYFKEENAKLPQLDSTLFLDSINAAYKHDLYTDKPTIYYTYDRKAYKKVAAIPITVREDLREFFSGYRNKEN